MSKTIDLIYFNAGGGHRGGGGVAVSGPDDEDGTSLNQFVATAVAETLIDEGCVVDRASDGAEGLSRIAESSYDVVICDLKMPRIDGMQFYRAMAAAMPALARRVIFVTGDVVGTDAERFLDETACRWLSKPFRLTDVVRAVRDTLG